jgi:uncharacterized damage-inducible protein DinB
LTICARFDYGYWANTKLLGVVAQLTPEQFVQPVVGGHGSIRNTLVHVMSAEWGWVDRCGGPTRGPALSPPDYPTLSSVVERWAQVEAIVREFLSRLTDDDLRRPIEFSLGGGPANTLALGELMEHGATHGVHHRGQVALMLRMLGQSPGNVDILFYYAERHRSPAS